MKFDNLIEGYLEEAVIGSRGGHMSAEEAQLKVDPQNDIDNFKFESDFISKKLIGYEIKNCWSLVSSPLSTYYYHTDSLEDSDEVTVLYYVNTRWDKNWGGETLFSNDLGECEIAVEYKPGRIVIFDSAIEHKPKIGRAHV